MQTTTEKLDKTLDSMNAFMNRGGTYRSKKAYELRYRYDDLKDTAKAEGTWDNYCETNNLDKSHNAGDCFA